MEPRRVLAHLGTLLRLFALTLIVPIVLGLLLEPRRTPTPVGIEVARSTLPFLWTFTGTLAAGLLLERLPSQGRLEDRELYVLTAAGWLACTVVTAVPYLLLGTVPGVVHALFEAISGLTTTGASVITVPLEELPAGLHVWRALSQWLGGLAILAVALAVLARLGAGDQGLIHTELPTGGGSALSRLLDSQRILWPTYLVLTGLTLVAMVAVFLTGAVPSPQPWLDGIVHALTSISTGGFSTRTGGLGAFGSGLLEAVVLVAILMGGTNMLLLSGSVRGRLSALARDHELRAYLLLVLVGGLSVAGVLLWKQPGQAAWMATAWEGLFHTASLVTTAGFTTVDPSAWPELARFLMLALMFVGASTVSTGGGLKVIRALAMLRVLQAELRRIAHPRAVLPVRVGGITLSALSLHRVVVFVFAYLTVFVAGTLLLLALEPLDVIDGVSATAAALGNIGPGLGAIGPTGSYAQLGDPALMLLGALMWIGRLELFAVLLLLSPETYR